MSAGLQSAQAYLHGCGVVHHSHGHAHLKFVQAYEAGVLQRFDRVLARMAVVNAKYSEDQVQADLK